MGTTMLSAPRRCPRRSKSGTATAGASAFHSSQSNATPSRRMVLHFSRSAWGSVTVLSVLARIGFARMQVPVLFGAERDEGHGVGAGHALEQHAVERQRLEGARGRHGVEDEGPLVGPDREDGGLGGLLHEADQIRVDDPHQLVVGRRQVEGLEHGGPEVVAARLGVVGHPVGGLEGLHEAAGGGLGQPGTLPKFAQRPLGVVVVEQAQEEQALLERLGRRSLGDSAEVSVVCRCIGHGADTSIRFIFEPPFRRLTPVDRHRAVLAWATGSNMVAPESKNEPVHSCSRASSLFLEKEGVLMFEESKSVSRRDFLKMAGIAGRLSGWAPVWAGWWRPVAAKRPPRRRRRRRPPRPRPHRHHHHRGA